jgi:hypothetical protein
MLLPLLQIKVPGLPPRFSARLQQFLLLAITTTILYSTSNGFIIYFVAELRCLELYVVRLYARDDSKAVPPTLNSLIGRVINK